MMSSVAETAAQEKHEARDVVLRPETAEDAELLRALYLSVRWHELAVTNWPDEAKHAFLNSQFQLQTRQYAANYPGMERWIVERAALPIGRLYVLRTGTALHVVDISLLPEWRGQGIGSCLLRELGRQADRQRIAVRLRVERNNPALRLYRRLGFEPSDTNDVYWLMERRGG